MTTAGRKPSQPLPPEIEAAFAKLASAPTRPSAAQWGDLLDLVKNAPKLPAPCAPTGRAQVRSLLPEFAAERATSAAIEHARASSSGYSIHRPKDNEL